ncbi:MAG: AAA family ATPase [Chloroherpetonaceae bacterium]|nr:AAA family ATPase [Chloroherpetonaceae bacterium]
MRIEKLHIKNFKVFADAEIKELSNMCVFLGANGSGKSTLFDVFGFLSACLKNNVRSAINNRGGYKEVVTRGKEKEDIEFEIKFRNEGKTKQPIITYQLSVGQESGKIVVKKEILSYRRGKTGRPYRFLDFSNGEGKAIVNEEEFEKEKQDFKEERKDYKLDAPDILAIKGLGQFQEFKAVADFRRLLDNWYIANFQIPDAKKSQDIGVSETLSPTGDNLALVADYIYENHRETFNKILEKMKQRVPGISQVDAEKTSDGRIVLRFQDGAFKDPFISRYVSDGTLKMFAYLILLYSPNRYPLLCIEEPENYLHPALLKELAEEFRDYANRGGQVFISSHSPDFVNALEIDELFWLKKENGYTTIHRAQDDDLVSQLTKEGDKLGWLWNQGYLKGSNPNS